MKTISDEQFSKLISRAMDELPQEYISGLANVVITYDDEPTEHQRGSSRLQPGSLLLGLYEGVPLPRRTGNESGILPDKITLFKKAILTITHDEDSMFEQIKRTLWHEIAHYYGLGHDKIHELETKK